MNKNLIFIICLLIVATIFIWIIDYMIEKTKIETEQAINNYYKHIHSFFSKED